MSIQDIAGPDGVADTSIETTACDERHASIALHGDIDAAVADALHTELQHHLDAGRCFIRVDTAGVTFLDSTAIGAMVTGAKLCVGLHGSLILTNVPTLVRRVIEITGLEGLLLADSVRKGQAQD